MSQLAKLSTTIALCTIELVSQSRMLKLIQDTQHLVSVNWYSAISAQSLKNQFKNFMIMTDKV